MKKWTLCLFEVFSWYGTSSRRKPWILPSASRPLFATQFFFVNVQKWFALKCKIVRCIGLERRILLYFGAGLYFHRRLIEVRGALGFYFATFYRCFSWRWGWPGLYCQRCQSNWKRLHWESSYGQVAISKRMNFQKSSKRPSIPPSPHFRKIR